ncbi:MAG: flavodoxin-dependent (E)-4-hydroxy-3-methylbut-2-enyl-diphosphate synthase [Ruminococcaceae bacterium]|nr:flavodoxin-dependent (E)-4-hydroxy-3-methylbut-2-enyl-diphosphate synthase [Oscillospiraceae bacterium]
MTYNEFRRKTRKVKVGNIYIGGDSPISVQTMANKDSSDIEALYAQIKEFEDAGADIVRIAIPNVSCASSIYELKNRGIKVPLVSDIHFDYKIALECAAAGVDKIRINPGNIGGEEKVKAVVNACKERNIPIRIGVNSGSVQKELLAKYGGPVPEALFESAMEHAKILEKYDFYDTVISIKASDVRSTVKANRLLAEAVDYPIHIGVTEAGLEGTGIIKSAVGIGSLLCDGIGDTVRVSLTADPVKEIASARNILHALSLDERKKINIVSCPTCGRTKIDLIPLVKELEDRIEREVSQKIPMTVAFMGCAVNGPGEAREADIGVAGGIGEAVLFKKGIICEKIPEEKICDKLIEEIRKFQEQ